MSYRGWCMCLIPSPNEQSECNECCCPVPRGVPLQPLDARRAGIDAMEGIHTLRRHRPSLGGKNG